MRAVLEGRETPHAGRQIERCFGHRENLIKSNFHHEAILLSALYRAYRTEQARKRLELIKDEVRTATFSLHAQGISSNEVHVSSMLSHQYWVILSEARET
jgi:hypothetical protein